MAISGRYRTEQDLITETLANLGVLAPGQSIDVEDYNYVAEKLDSLLRTLAALEICFVSDPNNIPGEWFASLADIMAGECATKFGANTDDYTRLKTQGLGVIPGEGTGARALKMITRGKPTGERLRVEYF
jgi:hypothetical protein